MAKREPAPGALALVEAFVNTVDVEDDIDALTDAAALRDWFVATGLDAGDRRYSRGDLERAIAVREALRELMSRNAGHPPGDDPAPVLTASADRARFSMRFAADDGVAHLTPTAAGADGAIGALLAIVKEAMADGSWARLKACRADTCQWAFYDRSRNASSTWCDMAICGSREKMRAYRERRRPRPLVATKR